MRSPYNGSTEPRIKSRTLTRFLRCRWLLARWSEHLGWRRRNSVARNRGAVAQAYGDLALSVATLIGNERLRSGLSDRLTVEECASYALRSGTRRDGPAPRQMNGVERMKMTSDSTPVALADRIITTYAEGESGVITRRACGRGEGVTAARRRSRRSSFGPRNRDKDAGR